MKIIDNISWWLQHMEQGMWMAPFQQAKDTTCVGWHLFSAKEYNQEELCKAIWSFTGVQLALRFWEIDDGVPHHANAKI